MAAQVEAAAPAAPVVQQPTPVEPAIQQPAPVEPVSAPVAPVEPMAAPEAPQEAEEEDVDVKVGGFEEDLKTNPAEILLLRFRSFPLSKVANENLILNQFHAK